MFHHSQGLKVIDRPSLIAHGVFQKEGESNQ
jgi:hypothetical protein